MLGTPRSDFLKVVLHAVLKPFYLWQASSWARASHKPLTEAMPWRTASPCVMDPAFCEHTEKQVLWQRVVGKSPATTTGLIPIFTSGIRILEATGWFFFFLPQNWLRARLVGIVVKAESASLHRMLTGVPGDRLLLKQRWANSPKGCTHRGDARSLRRVRRWQQEGQLTSCIVTGQIIICHTDHVHTAAEGAAAAWVDSAGLHLVVPAQVVMAV